MWLARYTQSTNLCIEKLLGHIVNNALTVRIIYYVVTYLFLGQKSLYYFFLYYPARS